MHRPYATQQHCLVDNIRLHHALAHYQSIHPIMFSKNNFMATIVNPKHTEGYSWLVANYAKCDYNRDRNKCSTMPSVTIVM